MANNNDLVVIQLDRPRVLRFGHKAMKMYQAMTGRKVDEFMSNGLDFEEIEQLLYCGILADALAHNETLTLEKVEDLLEEKDDTTYVAESIAEALAKAFDKKGNLAPGKKKK